MARKSAAQKRAEKKEVREIRADQDQEVINMYTEINSVRDEMRDLTPRAQQNEDVLNMWFDSTFPSSGKKATAKGRHHPYQAIKKLRARFSAAQLEMDHFEKTLTEEWAIEQKKSWQERDEYLERKVVEINEYCRKYKIEVKKLLTQAGIRITGLNDDEVRDESKKGGAEDQDEHAPAEERGDEATPVVIEESGGETSAMVNEEDGVEAEATDDDEDEKSNTEQNLDIEEKSDPSEEKPEMHKKKDKKKTKKPKRKAKKGKRR